MRFHFALIFFFSFLLSLKFVVPLRKYTVMRIWLLRVEQRCQTYMDRPSVLCRVIVQSLSIRWRMGIEEAEERGEKKRKNEWKEKKRD